MLMDRVKYHDLYLSAGCCSCAVNVILKPLYPLFEDLQYSRSHVSLSALKLHYQQPTRLSITHTAFFSFFYFFFLYLSGCYTHWISFKIMTQSAKCLNVETFPLLLKASESIMKKIAVLDLFCFITTWGSLYWNKVNNEL